MVVNSSRGGGSKDTWVLAGASPTTASAEEELEDEPVEDPLEERFDEGLAEEKEEQAAEPDPVTSTIPIIDADDVQDPQAQDPPAEDPLAENPRAALDRAETSEEIGRASCRDGVGRGVLAVAVDV